MDDVATETGLTLKLRPYRGFPPRFPEVAVGLDSYSVFYLTAIERTLFDEYAETIKKILVAESWQNDLDLPQRHVVLYGEHLLLSPEVSRGRWTR